MVARLKLFINVDILLGKSYLIRMAIIVAVKSFPTPAMQFGC